MKIKVTWLREGQGEDARGYWTSAEGRFDISPYGYRHGVTPDGYELQDRMGEQFVVEGRRAFRPRTYRFDTVRECKAKAVEIAGKTTRY